MIKVHNVSIAIGDAARWQWVDAVEGYSIAIDMLRPADAVTLRLPASLDMWELCKPDKRVNVFIDGTRVFSGIIDERKRTLRKSEGSLIEISARDKVGRLIDESAPLITYRGLGIVDLARKLASPLFDVTTSNASNRRLIVGPRLRQHSKEPPIDTGKGMKRKVQPGESIWQVLHFFLEESALLAWSSADGKNLIIGRPNYTQPAQWFFVSAGRDSRRALDTNVMEVEHVESFAERYSLIIAVGSKPGTATQYGNSVTGLRGIWKDGPNADGTGADFAIRKRLIVSDDGVGSTKGAQDRADREAAERNATGRRMRLVVAGHGHSFGDQQQPALYAVDTIARVIDEEIELEEDWFITGLRFRGSRSSGQTTDLDLVPVGTDLRMAG